MQELLLSLIRSHHSSAVLVTHDLDEALALSDRLLLMHRSPDQTLLTSWNLTDLLGSTSTSQPTLRSRSDLFEELRAEISLKLSTENLGFSD
jgi:ABC-type nitrate/sulfonate/bicarbonate transport system ATPase subunit